MTGRRDPILLLSGRDILGGHSLMPVTSATYWDGSFSF